MSLLPYVIKRNLSLKNSLITFVANILIVSINFSTGVITARYLGAQGRGEQTAMIMWSQLIGYSITLGLPSSIIYNLKKEKVHSDDDSLVTVTLLLSVLLGILGLVLGIFIIPFALDNFSKSVILFAQLAMSITPFILVTIVINPILKVNNEYKIFNRIRYFVPLATLVLLIFFIAIKNNNAFTFALAYLIPNIPISIWLVVKLFRIYNFNLNNFRSVTKDLLYYGFRSYGIDLIGTMSRNINQLILAILLSPIYLGLYTVSVSVSNILNIFQSSIVEVLFPSTAGKNTQEVVKIVSRSARISTTITGLFALFLMATAPILLKLVYGKEFLQATMLLRLLLLSVILSSTIWVLSQAFMSLNRPGVLTLLQLIGLLLTIPFCYIFIPIIGFNGAGIAILCSDLIRFLVTIICFPLVLKVPVPNIFLKYQDINWIKGKLIDNYIKKL